MSLCLFHPEGDQPQVTHRVYHQRRRGPGGSVAMTVLFSQWWGKQSHSPLCFYSHISPYLLIIRVCGSISSHGYRKNLLIWIPISKSASSCKHLISHKVTEIIDNISAQYLLSIEVIVNQVHAQLNTCIYMEEKAPYKTRTM